MRSLWRLFLLTMFGCLLPLGLIGCGGGEDDAATEDPGEAAVTEDVPPP